MAEEGEEGGGGGSKKLIIIIIIILLLLIGGGAAAYFFVFSKDDETTGKNGENSQEETEIGIPQEEQKEAAKLTNPLYTPAKKYTVNLRDGRHFLNVKLVAALEDPDALSYLAEREPIIDDMIVSLLGNKTTDDLRTPSGKDLLRREIHKKVNSVFSQEFINDSDTIDQTPVKQILFTEFILN